MECSSKSSEVIHISLDLFRSQSYQCAGRRFVEYYGKSLSKHGHELSRASSESNISDDNPAFEVDVDYLKCLNPKEWKDQDHYAVLGLKSLRFVQIVSQNPSTLYFSHFPTCCADTRQQTTT